MKLLRTSWKLDKNQIRIFIILGIIGIFIGFLFYKNIDKSLFIKDIENIVVTLRNTHINYLFMHFIILAILITSSLIVFGLVLFLIYFILEIACISYSIFIFADIFGASGFIYGIIYNFFNKFVFILCILLIFKNILVMIKNTIYFKFGKNNEKIEYQKQFRNIIFLMFIILIYDIFIYFLGNLILVWFSFIIS